MTDFSFSLVGEVIIVVVQGAEVDQTSSTPTFVFTATASRSLTYASGFNTGCSGLKTEMDFGEVKIRI